jgi:TRAP-type C4-dicarboxylate transport system permease large subunit
MDGKLTSQHLNRKALLLLTTFVNWCSPSWRSWLATVAELIVIVFVLEIIFPARSYLRVQASTELITLHISDAYQSGFSLWLVSQMAAVPGGSWGFLAVTIVAFIILGSVLEGLPAIVLFGPLLFPVAKAMGVHEVHYAMVVILAMGIGLFAPPFGAGFYGACAIGRTNSDDSLCGSGPISALWSWRC